MGEPIEAGPIHRAIGSRIGDSGEEERLFVESIKSIIGYTEGTAGIAGLMKVSPALQHGVILPNLLFKKLNLAIKLFSRDLKVLTRTIK